MADPAKAPGPRRLWRVLFALSLALNVAVVGLVAGFAFRNDRMGPPRGMDMSIGPIGAALSREDRIAILRSLRDEHGPRGMGRRTEVTEVAAALTASPFSPGDLEEVLRAGAERREAIVDAAMRAFVARVSGMTDAERAAFAARMLEGGKRHGAGSKRGE